MNHFSYTTIPAMAQFQKDSSVAMAIRKDDIVLAHIDWLLDRYQVRDTPETESVKRTVLCDLFMTCNFWIKSYHGGNKRMKKERYPAVLAVFEIVVQALSKLFGCKIGSVAITLEEIYGRDMHKYGIEVDHDQKRAKYLSKLERQIYRLRFKGGLAYQYPWWGKPISMVLQPANSSHADTPISRKGADGRPVDSSPEFGCFVMTLERELFMAKAEVAEKRTQEGIFHSSFTAGDMVTMAGTMLIRGGKILGIRADSGHYQPNRMNMALLLQGLGMYGVDLAAVTLYDWDGTELGSGFELIKSRMSWEHFKAQRTLERGHRADTDQERKARHLDPRFPHLPPRGPAYLRPGQAPVAPLVPVVPIAPSSTRDAYMAK